MLFEAAQWLEGHVRAFNVFTYITLRVVLAALTALAISFIVGPAMIRRLTAYKIGQAVRDDGPQTHLVKTGTPTMGGALILVSVAITTLLWADLREPLRLDLPAHHAGLRRRGLDRRLAQGGAPQPQGPVGAHQVLLAIADRDRRGVRCSPTARSCRSRPSCIVPFFKTVAIPLGTVGFVILGYFVVVGTSNAVNLTDGLDGLAIMPTVMIASALAVFAYVIGQRRVLEVPGLPASSRARASSRCSAARWRARGSPSCGSTPIRRKCSWATWARSRWAPRSAWWRSSCARRSCCCIMGGVFVVETLSVIIQVASFKLTGKRVFRMAPLHHHYELKGWKENQVVVRFWIITMMLVLFGLSTLKLR